MITKRKLKDEIQRLNYRIVELEERLCPCEDHDWKLTGSSFNTTDGYIFDDIYKYKCKRCGKIKETRIFLGR
jgi:hypothetical protein